MWLTFSLEMPGQLWVFRAGLCLDVNHSVLLPGQCAIPTSMAFRHLDFSRCPFVGTYLNTCNRENTSGLWCIRLVLCLLMPFFIYSSLTDNNYLFIVLFNTVSLDPKFHEDAHHHPSFTSEWPMNAWHRGRPTGNRIQWSTDYRVGSLYILSLNFHDISLGKH